jgi:hypothetical protein
MRRPVSTGAFPAMLAVGRRPRNVCSCFLNRLWVVVLIPRKAASRVKYDRIGSHNFTFSANSAKQSPKWHTETLSMRTELFYVVPCVAWTAAYTIVLTVSDAPARLDSVVAKPKCASRLELRVFRAAAVVLSAILKIAVPAWMCNASFATWRLAPPFPATAKFPWRYQFLAWRFSPSVESVSSLVVWQFELGSLKSC